MALEKGSTRMPTRRSATARETMKVWVGVRSFWDVKTAAITRLFPKMTTTFKAAKRTQGMMKPREYGSTYRGESVESWSI